MSSKPEDKTAGAGPADALASDSSERRFCSSCSRSKPLLGGAMVRCANGTKRWKCADCRARSKTHTASKQGDPKA